MPSFVWKLPTDNGSDRIELPRRQMRHCACKGPALQAASPPSDQIDTITGDQVSRVSRMCREHGTAFGFDGPYAIDVLL